MLYYLTLWFIFVFLQQPASTYNMSVTFGYREKRKYINKEGIEKNVYEYAVMCSCNGKRKLTNKQTKENIYKQTFSGLKNSIHLGGG